MREQIAIEIARLTGLTVKAGKPTHLMCRGRHICDVKSTVYTIQQTDITKWSETPAGCTRQMKPQYLDLPRTTSEDLVLAIIQEEMAFRCKGQEDALSRWKAK